MTAFIKLHLKENFKKNAFILFGIIGALVTIVFFSAGSLSVNNSMSDSNYAQYGYQWTLLSIMATLASIALSMGNVEKHRIGPKSQMLRLHGLSLEKQYSGIAIGNVLVAITVGMILLIGLIVSIFFKHPEMSIPGFFVAIGIYIISIITTGLVISLFTMIMPPAVAALIGIFFVILGSMKGLLTLLVENMGGLFNTIFGTLLKLIPDINGFGQLARDAFFGEAIDLHELFGNLIYLWILIGVFYLIIKGVAKNEK